MKGDSVASQDLFNIVVGIAGALGGWALKTIWDAVKDLQTADKELSKNVSAIQVLVAGEYIKRDDFNTMADAIFRKLDKIEDKLDGKADKP